MDSDRQKEEIEVIQSIYDAEELSSLVLRSQYYLKFNAFQSVHNKLSLVFNTPNKKVENDEDELIVEYLPPIELDIELPKDYPSTSPPIYSLSCVWLSYEDLQSICNYMDSMWSHNTEVLFSWTQFLKTDCLNFLQISTNPLYTIKCQQERLMEVKQELELNEKVVDTNQKEEKVKDCKANEEMNSDNVLASTEQTHSSSSEKNVPYSSYNKYVSHTQTIDNEVSCNDSAPKSKQRYNKCYKFNNDYNRQHRFRYRRESADESRRDPTESSNSKFQIYCDNSSNGYINHKEKNFKTFKPHSTVFYNNNYLQNELRLGNNSGESSIVEKFQSKCSIGQPDSRAYKSNRQKRRNYKRFSDISNPNCQSSENKANHRILSENPVKPSVNFKCENDTTSDFQSIPTQNIGSCVERGAVKKYENIKVIRNNRIDDLEEEQPPTHKKNYDPRIKKSSQNSPINFLRKYVESYNGERELYEFRKKYFMCNICLEDKFGYSCVQFKPCDHVFCRDCIRNFLQTKISEGTVQMIKCPESECDSDVLPGQIRELVGPEQFAKYDNLLLTTTLETMADIIRCPRQWCQYPVTKEPEEKMAVCPACHYVFCVLCKMVYHGVEGCRLKTRDKEALFNEYMNASAEDKQRLEQKYGKQRLKNLVETSLSERWIDDNSKNCCHCNAVIEKSEGCNKMICWRCNTFFCWNCLSRLDPKAPYTHYYDRNSPCFNNLFEGVPNNDDEFFFVLPDDEDDEEDANFEEAQVQL